MSNLHFKLMAFTFKIRDLLIPPIKILKEADIKPGFTVLDYGCGPGSYSITAARLVGETGKVYALDISPLALQQVQNIASKKEIGNIETIHTDCTTGLENDSVDVVLLYDTYHDLTNPDDVLKELYRILKPKSILSFRDHHLNEDEILSKMTEKGLFKLSRRWEKSYVFLKV